MVWVVINVLFIIVGWFLLLGLLSNVLSAVQVLEEHLFASGLNVDSVGKMEFLKARANLKGYDLTAVVCSTLKYEDGTSVYADTTEEDRK